MLMDLWNFGFAAHQRWEKTIFFVVFEDFQRRTQYVFNERKQYLLFQQKIHDQLPRYFCCFDDIANGLSYVDRVQHALMCVGMKPPIEADFVFCFIFQRRHGLRAVSERRCQARGTAYRINTHFPSAPRIT